MIRVELTTHEMKTVCDLLKDEARRIHDMWCASSSTAASDALQQAKDDIHELWSQLKESYNVHTGEA